MSYNIIRGAEKQGGYVSMVEKGRVNGDVRTIRYICGLGSMTYTEFKAFQKWAHSIKDQEARMAKVLSSGRAIIEKEAIPKRVCAAKAQRKTTVKESQKPRKIRTKTTVRKHYPVIALMGYRGTDAGKSHTQIMRERKKQDVKEAIMRKEAQLKKEGKLTKELDSLSASEKTQKRVIKGLLSREREREASKERRLRKEGFMFE